MGGGVSAVKAKFGCRLSDFGIRCDSKMLCVMLRFVKIYIKRFCVMKLESLLFINILTVQKYNANM